MISPVRTAALATFALLLVSAGSPPIIRSVDFSEQPEPVTVALDGVEVTLQPRFEGQYEVEVLAAIRASGYQSIIVPEGVATSSSFDRLVGIGRLSASDLVPSVLLAGFSGGAHCCAILKVVTPYAGKLKVIELASIDGEPDKTFPSDVSGDGVVDFVRQDDSFRYQFAGGAGSYSPPAFYNIYKGQLVNVSEEPSFRTHWTKFAEETRKVCFDRRNEDRNGACVAYVAAGARLGDFPGFLKRAAAYARDDGELASGCSAELVAYQCPGGKEMHFQTFETAATWFLRQHGYLD